MLTQLPRQGVADAEPSIKDSLTATIDRRRRRWPVFAGAVLLIGAAAVVVQVRGRGGDDAAAASDAAIQQTAELGGPRGFAAADPVPLLQGDPPPYRHEKLHGLTIAVQEATGPETGFLTAWETTVPKGSGPAACDALADWTTRVLQDAAQGSPMASDCRNALATAGEEDGVFATLRTPITAQGKYTVSASARNLADEGTTLHVVLVYEPSDPGRLTD
ncbi:hypothetical protein AB0J80_24285 [Actinoplanes sp. NPDC049548]|uniref:hypothetical protein n=1 Tax=Actinoplanes sp. NPDC049548 TaxID=3155152 RepID=UPI0034429F15